MTFKSTPRSSNDSSRTYTSPSKYSCGSMKDANKRYAQENGITQCLINELYFSRPNATSSENLKNQNTNQTSKLNENWLYKKMTNNDLNNPIVGLYYSISPPCINTNIQFMNRSNPIPIIYRNQNNNCDKYYTTFHS